MGFHKESGKEFNIKIQIIIVMSEVLGIVGSFLILLAWVFETFEAVKRHKNLIDLRFAAMYLPGIVLLAFYAYQIKNTIFLFLELAILIVVVFEIAYTVHTKRTR